jgi:hypothetical protein
MQENFLSVFSIASSVKKTLPYKIVSLYSIFFSKIVCQYRFNWYIFEYRCPSLVLGLRGMEKIFKIGQKNFLQKKSYMTLKYLLITDFPKFEPLTAAEMALCGNLGPKCQNLFPLV